MLPQLRSVGYDGIFQPRHISMASNFNGGRPDGVAIFWNTQKIEMDETVPVGKDGDRRLPIGWNGRGSLHAVDEDGKKNGKRAKQVALAVRLRVKETEQLFLVMTAILNPVHKQKRYLIRNHKQEKLLIL